MEKKGPAKKDTAIFSFHFDPLQCERNIVECTELKSKENRTYWI